MNCAFVADACQPATHDLRRFHGGCHHGPDGWQRLSQNYMRTTCFTHRGYFGMPRNDDCNPKSEPWFDARGRFFLIFHDDLGPLWRESEACP